MSINLSFFASLLIVCYVINLSETMRLFPLNNDVCIEILHQAGVDVTDVKIIRHDLDAKSTLQTGQSPNREVFRLFIDYEKDSQTYNTTFLVKAPISSIMYNFLYKYGVYEKEFALYSKVFPEMSKLEQQSFSAKFIAGDDSKYINTLILEDIYSSGFNVKPPDALQHLNVHECQLVFEMLGKFHALSIILDKRELIPEIVKIIPEPENEYEDEDTCQDCDKARAYFDQGMNHFVQNLSPEIKEKYAEKLDSIKDNITDKVNEGMKNSLNVIAHGNLMPSKLLFKYNEENNVAEQVKLMDFQAAKWNPPLIDIFYLAITGMKFEDVQQHLDSLLEIYSTSMNELLKKHQVDLYPLEDLKNDMRKQHLTFMWICGVVLPLMNNPQVPVELDGYSFKEPLSADSMATVYSSQTYVDAASKWFMFFVERGLFED
ncbi:uncharacterized protein LOC135846479 [Planococcus citri]|uniref:uncharacterized protein LOC135846479 n=1 Tax=Planococcus citri TaxID=170843 RepID=UPI0031F9AA88